MAVASAPTRVELRGTALGELVNLNRFKKKAARAKVEDRADANRARFGRTKSERAQEEHRTRRARDRLDQHRLDDDKGE